MITSFITEKEKWFQNSYFECETWEMCQKQLNKLSMIAFVTDGQVQKKWSLSLTSYYTFRKNEAFLWHHTTLYNFTNVQDKDKAWLLTLIFWPKCHTLAAFLLNQAFRKYHHNIDDHTNSPSCAFVTHSSGCVNQGLKPVQLVWSYPDANREPYSQTLPQWLLGIWRLCSI